jgi:hypothetical protein
MEIAVTQNERGVWPTTRRPHPTTTARPMSTAHLGCRLFLELDGHCEDIDILVAFDLDRGALMSLE